jgi:hypothetical protein
VAERKRDRAGLRCWAVARPGVQGGVRPSGGGRGHGETKACSTGVKELGRDCVFVGGT